MVELILAIISAVASIVVAIVGGYFALLQSRQKAHREKDERRAEQCKKESFLSMAMVDANTELTICMALNMVRDIPLCDIEEALEKAKKARDAYHQFLEEVGKEHFQ